MVFSIRFPFSFSQPPNNRSPPNSSNSRAFPSKFAVAAAIGAGAVAVACFAAAKKLKESPETATKNQQPLVQEALDFFFAPRNCNGAPMFGSISLADDSPAVVEPKTGVSFPSMLGDSLLLLGIGLRKKSVMGLKNIDVYAFGVYADDRDIKNQLGRKYGNLSESELKGKKEFVEDLMESDVSMSVRLQVVYSRLSIRSVRSAFEDSVGNRLQKFGGSDNKELLQRFTSQFRDDIKIPTGSVIDLSKERGHVLRTSIDGKEVGCIQSKLLCRSILDLYIGEDPFDRQAKDEVEFNAACLVHK